jgi:hypothetical protein
MRCCLNWFSLNCLRMKYQNSVSFVKHVVSDILVLFERTCETSKVGRLLWQEYNTWPNQEQDIANTTQQNFVIIWSFNIWCLSQTYTVHKSTFTNWRISCCITTKANMKCHFWCAIFFQNSDLHYLANLSLNIIRNLCGFICTIFYRNERQPKLPLIIIS